MAPAIHGHRGHDDDSDQDLLHVGGPAHLLAAVAEKGHHQGSHHGPQDASLAPGEAASPDDHRRDDVELGPEDLAFLQYTGGTTGVAKGAMLTHRNMVANMLQAKEWMVSTGLGTDHEYVISALPLYHIFALTANCFAFMLMGGTNVLITNPRDMPGFVKELSKVPFSMVPGVNTLFNGLLHTPGFADLDFSHLKGALGGGMAVQRAVAERWKEVTGTSLVEAYGLTETSPAACINPMDIEEFNGCIGLPISSTEGGIMDDEGKIIEGILILALAGSLVILAVLSAPLVAQESDADLEARVEALEQLIRDQHAQFEEQRERMEETIREQQRDIEDQRRQLSSQYELIRQLQAPTIDRVAKNWVAQVCHVDADLVGAAGLEDAMDERDVVFLEALDDLDVCDRLAAGGV